MKRIPPTAFNLPKEGNTPPIVRERGYQGQGLSKSTATALLQDKRKTHPHYEWRLEHFDGVDIRDNCARKVQKYGVLGTLKEKAVDISVTIPVMVHGKEILANFPAAPTKEQITAMQTMLEQLEDAWEAPAPKLPKGYFHLNRSRNDTK
jgi:hypothetical protein